MTVTEAELTARAIAAYARQSVREGFIYEQPADYSGIEEVRGKEYVVLRNVKGILAVYRVRNDGVLKGLKRWPKELDGAAVPE